MSLFEQMKIRGLSEIVVSDLRSSSNSDITRIDNSVELVDMTNGGVEDDRERSDGGVEDERRTTTDVLCCRPAVESSSSSEDQQW